MNGSNALSTRVFVLFDYCYLVKGAYNGAIYNTASGEVFSVSHDALTLVRSSQNWCNTFIPKDTQSTDYFGTLGKLGLGYFVTDGTLTMGPKPLDTSRMPLLQFAWCELTDDCNLNCQQCYAGSSPSMRSPSMSEVEWMFALQEIRKTGCRKLQFIGGEPLIHRKLLLSLIDYADSLGFQFVEVYSNCTLLDESVLRIFSDRHVAVATTVYSCDSSIHDAITRSPGSFIKTIGAIQCLIKRGLPVRVGIVQMKQNECTISHTISFLKNMGVTQIKVDTVRSAGRGCNTELLSETLIEGQRRSQPLFPPCNSSKFVVAHYGHNCFARNICIGANGDIRPCIMERNLVFGNIRQGLSTVLEDNRVRVIRCLTKDQIEVCRDCEYRYCCFDCRIQASTLYGKPSNCSYDPYTGKW